MASDTKQKKKYKAVRPKLRLFRAKEPVLSVFMWGINHTIHELHHINVPVMLMPDDFKAYSKIKIDNHNFNKENMPSHFKFKEYCPLVFRDLRERFGVSDEDFMDSLTKHSASETDSPGRSGARFLLSRDKKHIIKTIGGEEVAEMHRILKEYHQDSLTRKQPWEDEDERTGTYRRFQSYDRKYVVHRVQSDDVGDFLRIGQEYHQYVVERHGETLLPHFLGMYRITVNDNETYMVVMKNIFSPRLNVHKKYDLKGSTVQREASDKEKAKDLPTYKDNDFLNEKMTIQIGETDKAKLMDSLQHDVQFLVTQNLMDYSLLVGVHDLDRAEQEALEAGDDDECDENGAPGTESEEEVGDDECDENGAPGTESEEEVGDDDECDENGAPGTESEEEMLTPPISASPGGAGLAAAAAGGAAAPQACAPTPPDSPMGKFTTPPSFTGELDTAFEKFALKCSGDCPRREIYFLALIDILTHYGMKKRSAQAAKAVKYGANAEISTVKPEQYAKRFTEFIDKIIV